MAVAKKVKKVEFKEDGIKMGRSFQTVYYGCSKDFQRIYVHFVKHGWKPIRSEFLEIVGMDYRTEKPIGHYGSEHTLGIIGINSPFYIKTLEYFIESIKNCKKIVESNKNIVELLYRQLQEVKNEKTF